MAEPKIMTGARAVFKVNNKVIAYATNVGWRIGIPHQPINVLGRYSAARLEPLGYDVTVNCGVLRFTKEGGQGNSAEAQDVRPKLQQLISWGDVTVEIIDRKTNETVLFVERARLTDQASNIDARGVWTETWTFVGIIAENSDAKDQAEASPAGKTPPNTAAAE
jgi:hypothetical protein